MSIDALKFGSLANNQYYPIQKTGVNYKPYQGQGQKQYTPQIGGYSTQDLETALQVANGNYNINPAKSTGANFFTSKPQDIRGAGWEGFSTQSYTGTGELSPVVEGREDSLNLLKDYYA